MTAKAASALEEVLTKLEKAYGAYVTPGDPVEAGVMALLAAEAPSLSTEETRDRIRQAFVDWNEARVADPWDVTNAMEASGSPESRAFARAMIRFLESAHNVLNRCSFEVPPGEMIPDWQASLDRMRGATPAARAVCMAMLTPAPGWCVTPDMVKAVGKLGLVGKTTSATKIAAALAEICPPEDRLRTHYLLARYGARAKEDADPMADEKKPAKAAKAPKKAAKD